jgi:hypothetical protein
MDAYTHGLDSDIGYFKNLCSRASRIVFILVASWISAESVEEATSKTRPSNLEKLRMDPQFLFDAIRILKLQM